MNFRKLTFKILNLLFSLGNPAISDLSNLSQVTGTVGLFSLQFQVFDFILTLLDFIDQLFLRFPFNA